MQMSEVRKIVKISAGTHMVTIPPYFLRAMDATDCKEVLLTIKDKDHIEIELIREEIKK